MHKAIAYISAQYCDKQMSEIWCKNIQVFLRYSNLVLGYFILPHPVEIFSCKHNLTSFLP